MFHAAHSQAAARAIRSLPIAVLIEGAVLIGFAVLKSQCLQQRRTEWSYFLASMDLRMACTSSSGSPSPAGAGGSRPASRASFTVLR